jgi:hypothetical protein
LGACTPQINTEELEQQIKDELSSQTGVTPTSVDCPQDVPAEEGDTFRAPQSPTTAASPQSP